jgi:hypothetical protein
MDAEEVAALYADLGGVPEVAAELGVQRKRVHRWVERREATLCPWPVRTLVGLSLYSLSEWRTWWEVWRRTRSSESWWPYQSEPAPTGVGWTASMINEADASWGGENTMNTLRTAPEDPDVEEDDDEAIDDLDPDDE